MKQEEKLNKTQGPTLRITAFNTLINITEDVRKKNKETDMVLGMMSQLMINLRDSVADLEEDNEELSNVIEGYQKTCEGWEDLYDRLNREVCSWRHIYKMPFLKRLKFLLFPCAIDYKRDIEPLFTDYTNNKQEKKEVCLK